MFFRVISLFIMSSTALGAIVPVVTDDMSTGFVDSSWLDVDGDQQALDSFQSLTIDHSGSQIGALLESPDRELNILYMNDMLNAITVNEDGSQLLGVYPTIENAIGTYGISSSGAPYILDTESDVIWQWETDYWMDLSTLKNMPSGDFVSTIPYAGGYLLSTESNEEETLWHVGNVTQQVSSVSWPAKSNFLYTSIGILQLYNENLTSYTGNWIGTGKSDFVIDVNFVDYPYVYSAATSTGTFLHFYNKEKFKLIWLSSESSLTKNIELPKNWRRFYGCFTSYPKAFCILDMEDVGLSIYELENGEFILDTQLNEAFSGKTINGIYSIGKNRFISAHYSGASGNYSYLYSINEEGVETTMEVSRSSVEEPYYIFPSNFEEGAFYWIGKGFGETNIYKAEASGNFIFDRNLDSIVPIVSAEDGSSGGSGTMPVYLLVMLLMLLRPGVRWRQI